MFSFKDVYREHVVYALVNEADKRVYIGQTKNLLSGLYHLSAHLETKKYKLMRNDIEKLSLVILDTHTDARVRKHKILKYRNAYLNDGYVEYIPSNFIRYRAKLEIGRHYNTTLYYFVNLYDAKNDRILVGAFNKKEEAEMFFDTHYRNGEVDEITMASNELSDKLIGLYNDVILEGIKRT